MSMENFMVLSRGGCIKSSNNSLCLTLVVMVCTLCSVPSKHGVDASGWNINEFRRSVLSTEGYSS